MDSKIKQPIVKVIGADLSKAVLLTTSGTRVSDISIDTSTYQVLSISSASNFFESENHRLYINGNTYCSGDNGIYEKKIAYGSGVGKYTVGMTWVNSNKLDVSKVQLLNMWQDDGCGSLIVVAMPK